MSNENNNKGVHVSKPILISIVAGGILIMAIAAVIWTVIWTIGDTDGNVDDTGTETVNQIEEEKPQKVREEKQQYSQYYKGCSWCPNYGYVTNAKLVSDINIDTENEAYYVYSFSEREMEKYIDRLEEMFFERNPFSKGEHILYSRKHDNADESVSLVIDYDKKEITIYANKK